MPHGNYNVQAGMDVEAGKQAQRDSSYRACLHAMLIFIAICIILLVCAWPWNNHRGAGGKSSNVTDPSSAAAKGGEYRTTTTSRSPGVRSSTTLKPTTTPSTTTAKPTTFLVDRKNPDRVIAVEETEPPTVPVTSTTQRSTTARRVEEPVDTDRRLGVTHTTQQSATAVEDENDIVVFVHETDSTAATTVTAPGEDATEEAVTFAKETSTDPTHDVAGTPTDGTTTSVIADPRVETTESSDVVVTTTEETATDPTDDVAGTPTDGTTTTVISETTVDSNFGVDVFSTGTSNNDDTRSDRYVTQPDSSEPTRGQTDKSGAVSEDPDDDEDATVPNFTSPGSGLVCKTSHCKALATRMLSLMDHSVEPCDDLYEHACGGLRSNPSLLGDDPSKDVYDRIRRGLNKVNASSCQAHKTFKRYYESCVQYDAAVTQVQRIAEARKIIDKVGQFNDVDNPNPVLTDLTSLIVKLMQYHSTPLFDIMLDVDGHNPTQFALKLTAPVFKPMFRPFDRREDCLNGSDTMTDLNSFYHDYVKCKKEQHEVYLKELDDTVSILKIPISPTTNADIQQNMEFEVLSLIAELPSAGEMQQTLTNKEYVETSIADLIQEYPKVDWRTLIKAVLKRDLPDDTFVQVYFKDYLTRMFASFTDLEESKQQNVLLAWFAHDVYVDLVRTRDTCSREAYCLRVASDLMEETASSLYLSTFGKETLLAMEKEAQQVFSKLQETLERQLHDAEWLDASSRSAAVNKLKNLKLTVDGGVTVFRNVTFLNERMKEITQIDSTYIYLSAALLKRYRRQMYSLYGVNPSEPQAMWTHFLLPHSTQGIVVYALKNVVIPYGLMTHPMYEPKLPRYLLMARLGFVIAHEMAHHFDVIGMTYGTNGRGDSLLSHTPGITFRNKTDCLKDTTSFTGTKETDDGRSVAYKANESLSLNERLADRMGASLAYQTYLAWVRQEGEPEQLPYLRLTNNEVYFLAIAQIFCSKSSISDYGVSLFEDEHLPPFLRVNTVMDNSNEFSDAFQCKIGVDMNRNPDIKCEAFPKLTEVFGSDITPSN